MPAGTGPPAGLLGYDETRTGPPPPGGARWCYGDWSTADPDSRWVWHGDGQGASGNRPVCPGKHEAQAAARTARRDVRMKPRLAESIASSARSSRTSRAGIAGHGGLVSTYVLESGRMVRREPGLREGDARARWAPRSGPSHCTAIPPGRPTSSASVRLPVGARTTGGKAAVVYGHTRCEATWVEQPDVNVTAASWAAASPALRLPRAGWSRCPPQRLLPARATADRIPASYQGSPAPARPGPGPSAPGRPAPAPASAGP